MPKRAIIRRTNSVKGGPRSKGGGTRNNGWNCLVLVVLGLPIAFLLGLAGLAAAVGHTPVMLGGIGAASGLYAAGELLTRGGAR